MTNNITSNKFVKMFLGQKRESEVWKHSTYDQQNRKSRSDHNLHSTSQKSTLGNSLSLRLRHHLHFTGDPGSTAQTCGGTVTGSSVCGTDSLHFWEQNSNMRTSKLAHLAQDLICAPASHASVERVISLCGILTARRRSSMRKLLEMCVFLKLNQEILQQTGFPL